MSDLHYDKVSLLLPMSGVNNGTEFPDYSPVPKAVTGFGDTKTVTAQSTFYGSSGYFDGTGDYLKTPNNADFNFGSGDFAAEGWARFNSLPASGSGRAMLGKWRAIDNQRAWYLQLFNLSGAMGILFGWSTTGDNGLFEHFLWEPTIDTWYHIAATREGNNIRCFVDGVQLSTTRTVSDTIFGSSADVLIGAQETTSQFHIGYIQDIRITKGVARYTENFTPPARLVGEISGVITDENNAPAVRKVFAVPRLAPTRTFGPVDSNASGEYSLQVPSTEVSRIVLATDVPLYNDLIDRVIPC